MIYKDTLSSNSIRYDIQLFGKTLNINILGFPGGAVVESLPANAGDTG